MCLCKGDCRFLRVAKEWGSTDTCKDQGYDQTLIGSEKKAININDFQGIRQNRPPSLEPPEILILDCLAAPNLYMLGTFFT